MTKSELSQLLHYSGLPVNEWLSSKENESKYPRCVYWPYIDEDIPASGDTFTEKTTYQISIYSLKPEVPELKKIRKKLRELGIPTTVYMEYVEKDKVFHHYFALEVIDDEYDL